MYLAHDNWRETESVGDAVRRLTAMIDERNAKKRKALAGCASGAGKDSDQQPIWSHGRAENAAGERLEGSGSLNRQPQSTPVTEDDAGDHTAGGMHGGSGLERGERAAVIDNVSRSNGCARPDAPGSTTGFEDRAVTRPGGL